MKNKEKGFTLVELLAVIVILAIILVIAVPKVMSVIEDSKKATLESTAKMIASAAEKKKMENEVFDDNTKINCKDVVKLNDVDYDRCIIEFDNVGNAKVTIKGKGKFTGLNVCVGDKTTSTATETSCNVTYGNGAIYIEKLEAFNGNENGLVKTTATYNGTTYDAGIRYSGALDDVKNKVYFNCKDTDETNVAYGETNYDYASSCEVWRIIGLFDVDDGDGNVEKRIKIVSDEFNENLNETMSFHYSTANIETGINQWGESTYIDSNGVEQLYAGASLMQYLNDNTEGNYFYNLNVNAKNMIENALWYTGAKEYSDTISLNDMYEAERGSKTGKSLCTENVKYCNDTVKRTTEWVGKIALIYPSDFGYASADASCAVDIIRKDSTCKNNNWLLPTTDDGRAYHTITPAPIISIGDESEGNAMSSFVYFINTTQDAVDSWASKIKAYVRPALYLSSSVQIIGGDGNAVPYKLAI